MRRAEDRNRIAIFDRYKPPLLIGMMIVLSLSILDAILTLTLLSQDAKELNPVMRYYLSHYVKPTARKLLFVWSEIQAWLRGDSRCASTKSEAQAKSLINI